MRAGICKMPKHVVPPPPKSQYELERDARIKRNEEWMLAHGFNPYGSGPLKEKKTKSPPKPRAPTVTPSARTEYLEGGARSES